MTSTTPSQSKPLVEFLCTTANEIKDTINQFLVEDQEFQFNKNAEKEDEKLTCKVFKCPPASVLKQIAILRATRYPDLATFDDQGITIILYVNLYTPLDELSEIVGFLKSSEDFKYILRTVTTIKIISDCKIGDIWHYLPNFFCLLEDREARDKKKSEQAIVPLTVIVVGQNAIHLWEDDYVRDLNQKVKDFEERKYIFQKPLTEVRSLPLLSSGHGIRYQFLHHKPASSDEFVVQNSTFHVAAYKFSNIEDLGKHKGYKFDPRKLNMSKSDFDDWYPKPSSIDTLSEDQKKLVERYKKLERWEEFDADGDAMLHYSPIIPRPVTKSSTTE